VAFTEKNIAEDSQAMEELTALGFMSVPVTVVDGEVIPGFQPAKLTHALGLA
jgi:hypothetical protein